MDHPESPEVLAPGPGEEPLVDLIQQHIEEATTHELHRKGLIAEPHGPDHDQQHADPLRPADPSAPEPYTPEKRREIL